MALREIRKQGDPILNKECKPVKEMTPRIRELIEDMFETMYFYEGIGLAAPQIGVSKRLVVIDVADTDEQGNVTMRHPMTLVNPEILEKYGEVESQEGCLSVPEIYEVVHRAERIKIKYFDLQGQEHIEEAEGLLAICMQHELDHLEGHLFIDYLGTFQRERIKKRLIKFKKEHLKH